MKKTLQVILCSLFATSAMSMTYPAGTSTNGQFIPKNDMKISVDDKSAGGLTEDQFHDVLDRVESIYEKVVADDFGKQLKIERYWTDSTVNAYAYQNGESWNVAMFGGLARFHTVTPDAFALVACHELGHHLGGAPRKFFLIVFPTWATNEGQSDYFATTKCLRKYFESDDNISIVEGMDDVPAYVDDKCRESFTHEEEVAICIRSSMAGLHISQLFNEFVPGAPELDFKTPSEESVWWTDGNHPAAQCRLDTYFQGALCDKDAYSDFSKYNRTSGACTRLAGYKNGIRPRCWYSPVW